MLQQPGRQGGENDSPREPSLARDFPRLQVLAPAPSAGVPGGAGHLALGSGRGGARPREPVRRGSRGQRPLPQRPRAPLHTLPPGLTLTSRAAPAGRAPAPGAPLRPNPVSVPLSLTLLAGGSGRGSSAAARGRLLAPGELGARRRQPAPAARPAPAAPGPPPPVTKAGLRPDTGRAQEERARLRVAGVNVPDVGRVGAASAPSAAGTPRPVPRGRNSGGGRVCKHRLLRGAGSPLGRRLTGYSRSPAPGPAQVGEPRSSRRS